MQLPPTLDPAKGFEPDQSEGSGIYRAREVTKDRTRKDKVPLTLAQQQLQVAMFDAQSAAQAKQAAILRGEGQAEAARLVMSANGALEQKLAAWQEVNARYADAIAQYRGNWVPSTVFGGSSGSGASASAGSGASDLITLLTAKTAKDISLDLGMQGSAVPEVAGH